MTASENTSENMSPEAQALFDKVMETFEATDHPTFDKDKLEQLSTDDLIVLQRAMEEKIAEANEENERLFQLAETKKTKVAEYKPRPRIPAEYSAEKDEEKAKEIMESYETELRKWDEQFEAESRQRHEYMEAHEVANKMWNRYMKYCDLSSEVRDVNLTRIQAEANALSRDVEEDRLNIEGQAAALENVKAGMAKTSQKLDQALTAEFEKKPPEAKA